jgi:type IX secretion system substrate protein
MIKRVMAVLVLVGLFASVSNAQWTDMGAFPDTSFTGSTHGIAVDPDGKVWWTSYYKQIPWISGTDTVATNGIFVFNADGTEADFSPIVTVATGGGFVVDTLISSGARGLAADHEGNIIYVQSGKIFKINYQTGEGMARHDITEVGSSPTGPGIADDGTIFVGPVVGGGTTQIAMYDTDLNYVGSAVDGPPAISRCLEVSGDGNSIYWTPFTGNAMYIYNRADEFSAFELADSALIDMSIESVRINPVTGLLWVSSDSRKTTYSSTKWFAFDTVSKALVDSFTYTPKDPEAADILPRGLAFTDDGMTAYVGTFSSVQYGITKFVFGAVGVNEVGSEIPSKYALSQNYPNPFNPSTVINFSIPESGLVTMKVYNLLGQEVAELVNDVKSAGSYEVSFDATDFTSGLYVYKIQAGQFSASRKMLLIK